jgi:hypothetical protein
LTVIAAGTVNAERQLDAGIPLEDVEGVLACFEFAAHTPRVGDALLGAARRLGVEASPSLYPLPLESVMFRVTCAFLFLLMERLLAPVAQ